VSDDPDIKSAIRTVVEGGTLDADLAAAAMDQIMTGAVTPAQIGALVTALRMRGETVEEIAGFASAMRRHALRVDVDPEGGVVVDTCGTGGDASGTFNISTTAAFVIAGAGIRVAKHGNRSVTSKCGSADLLEGLGVAIELSPSAVARCVDEVGIGFMYAPAFHPAMKYVGPTRREIGIRTVFNVLGPLTNPALPPFAVIGAFDLRAAARMAEALSGLGVERAFVIHGEPGWDEATPVGAFTLYDVRHGSVRETRRDPRDLGLARCAPEALHGGDATHNAARLRAVLRGEDRGAHRDALVLGCALALEVTGRVPDWRAGVDRAYGTIDSGRAAAWLERFEAACRA